MGGIVSEPPGDARAGMLLIAPHGRPARSGVNSFWARLARRLAERGVVVLRLDNSREGETLPIGEGGSGQEWRRKLDMMLLRQAMPWFRERLEGLDLLLAGSCSGGRAAIELAGRDPSAVAGTFLIVPHLRVPVGAERAPGERVLPAESDDPDAIDPPLVELLRTILSRGPSWVLVGDGDKPDIPALIRLLGPTPHDLELDLVPDAVLHLLDTPDLQQPTERWLLDRVSRLLADRAGDAASPTGARGSPSPRARA